MNELLVILGASKTHGTLEKYLGQLHAAGIEAHTYQISGEFQDSNNLGTQVAMQRKFAKEFSNYQKLIFSDAFDVTFYGTKSQVLEKIPWNGVLIAAERNCSPDATLEKHMPGETAWKFVNGGMFAGTPQSFLRWLDAIEGHPIYNPKFLNQGFFNILRFTNSPLVRIDHHTELFYVLHHEQDELQFEQGMPVNTALGTRPCFLHAAGKWPMKGIVERRDRSLGITKQEVRWKIPRCSLP
jgi:hypothetical protein